MWLSTAGAGVAWLHVRLDDRPKYYGYPPFTGAIAPRLRAIAGKLDQLIREGCRPSGWEAHQMRSAPAVSEAELVSFEHLHGVQLPADYRAFLQQVSGGGLGPALGLIPLGKYPREWHSESLKDSLRDPFPYTKEYAPQPDQVGSDLSRHTVGTLVVCHEGCGSLHRLVVSGPARGQVWIDGTCSDYGLRPIAGSFLDWYESWLDHALLGGNGLA